MTLDIDLIDARVTAWHETFVGQRRKKPRQKIWFNSNCQPSAGSTTVVLHKHTEKWIVKRRKSAGNTIKKEERR
jgi:hypothetical protein